MKRFAAFVLLVFFLLSCGGNALKDPTALKGYTNDFAGIYVPFTDEWEVFTYKEEAKYGFGEYLPKKENMADSHFLFAAFNPLNKTYCRLIRDAHTGTTLSYFEYIYSISKDNFDTISARFDKKSDTVEWIYRAKASGIHFVFKELITKNRDNMLRFCQWVPEALFERHKDEFIALSEKVRFNRAKKIGKGKYHPIWEGIHPLLEGKEISSVKTVSLNEPEKSVCTGPNEYMFWKVKGKKNTVYLFGSLHVGDNSFYPMADHVEKAFSESRYLTVELDVESKAFKEKSALFMKNGIYEDGKTLSEDISPEVMNKLKECIGKIGLPADNFLKLKPWMLCVSLPALKMQSMGYSPELGIDRYFLEKARSRKEIVEMESFEEQLALLESFNTEDHLAYTLLGLNTFEVSMNKMVESWRCGDSEGLSDIIFEKYPAIDGIDDILDNLYVKRNQKMTEKISNYLKGEGNYFVVVGSGHLIGEKGIITLLNQKGFDTERM